MDFIAVSIAGKADTKAERANEKAIKVEESTKVLKSVAYTGYVEEGRLEGSVVGENSTAEGSSTVASAKFAHAEGNSTKALCAWCHAEGEKSIAGNEGYANAIGAHAEGYQTLALGRYSHAEGSLTIAGNKKDPSRGAATHAEGFSTQATENYAHAEGIYSIASGYYSHAEGTDTKASGSASHAEGRLSVAQGENSHAGGDSTIANECQYAIGRVNIASSGGSGTSGDVFIIGNGINLNGIVRSNAFRVSAEGSVYAAKTYNSNGADYAELFEWQDGNANKEDRRGLFVTMDGEHIRLSDSPSDYILGIVSAAPAMLGNQFADYWNGMYEVDIFGSPLYQEMTSPAITDHDGNAIASESKFMNLKINPNYDSSQPYVPRDKRKEWAMIGMIGKLVMVDDGTCVVNGYCQPSAGGKATKATAKTDYRVIARLDETHIKVLIK